MMKKLYVDIFILLLLHIYRRHLLLPIWKMCPISDVLLMGKDIIILFQIKRFKSSYSKNIHN